MSLTVRALIAKLKKMDPDALVAWQAHDQNLDEIDGFVRTVYDAEPALIVARSLDLEATGKKHIVVLGA